MQIANCDEVRNITTQIFGEKPQILPLAFGDFNSDKLTDVIAINEDRTKISILLAEEQTFTSSLISHHTYFKDPAKVDKKKLKIECNFNDEIIESVAPGDFDGDGGMDLFVLVKREDEEDDMVRKRFFCTHEFTTCFMIASAFLLRNFCVTAFAL